jgi:amidophosphoribosyltransferase
MSTRREFIAAPNVADAPAKGVRAPKKTSKNPTRGSDRTEEDVRAKIGADSLLYQTLDDMVEAVRAPHDPARQFCMACMDGHYPTGDVTAAVLAEIEDERLAAGEN